MSDLLAIGASGVRTYQTALSTVSENIANVDNPAYARRSIDVREIAAPSTLVTAASAMNGFGSIAAGVNRASDMFKSAAVRTASADLARTQSGSVWLDRIQSAMTGADLSTSLTNFFNAAKSIAADPSSATPRTAMLESASTLAASFTSTGNALAQVTADMDATAQQATADLGSLATALAKVNDGLSRTSPGSAQAANLADQRDSILDQMSALVDVNVTFDAAGRASVRAGGEGGPALVSGNDAASVSYVRNASGAVTFVVQTATTASVLVPNGGALAGIVDGAQRIADARDQLNTLASGVTSGVNALQAQGRDLNGNAGQPIFSTGAAPTDISVSLTDPAGIAAAAVGGGTRDNANILQYETLRTTGGFEGKLTGQIAANAAALQNRKTVAAAQGAIRDNAVTARDAVSGVDLDTEAVELLRFQQAYSASSRIIQVARDTFQSILDIR